MQSISTASKGGTDDASALASSLTQLAQIKMRLNGTPRLRPWIEFWISVEEAVGCLQEVARGYLHALASPNPGEAQRLGSEAQAGLDRGAQILERFNARFFRWMRIEETGASEPVENTAVMASFAYESAQADNVADLDRAEAQLFSRLSDSEPCPPGLGVSLITTEVTVQNVMDAERFWRVARTAYEVFRSSRQLAILARNDVWREHMDSALTELLDAGEEAGLLASATNPRFETRTAIRLGHNLTEKVSRPLLASLLTCLKRKDYVRLAADHGYQHSPA